MIGCLFFFPIAGLFVAMAACMSAVFIAMGVFISSLIAYSTAFLTFMIIIFS
jgi:hypothetical protein